MWRYKTAGWEPISRSENCTFSELYFLLPYLELSLLHFPRHSGILSFPGIHSKEEPNRVERETYDILHADNEDAAASSHPWILLPAAAQKKQAKETG